MSATDRATILGEARACLAMDPPSLGNAAYHCQQAAEKTMKGLLVAAGVSFRKIHDLDELANVAAPLYPTLAAISTSAGHSFPGPPNTAIRPKMNRRRRPLRRFPGRLRFSGACLPPWRRSVEPTLMGRPPVRQTNGCRTGWPVVENGGFAGVKAPECGGVFGTPDGVALAHSYGGKSINGCFPPFSDIQLLLFGS